MYDIRIHVRHCLLYEFQMGHTAAEATRNICTYVAADALSHSMAKYWFHRFRQGDFNVEDRPRSGRPSTIDTGRLQLLIQADSTRTTRSLANELETSHSTVERHLHELGMQFHVDRWVYVGVPSNVPSNSTTPVPPQPPPTNASIPGYDQPSTNGNGVDERGLSTPATSSSNSSSRWTQPSIVTTQHQQDYNWQS